MSLREADPITEVSKPHSSEIEHRPREVDPFVCDIGNGFQEDATPNSPGRYQAQVYAVPAATAIAAEK